MPTENRPRHRHGGLGQDGQALAEFLVGIIAMTVVVLVLILMADLCRARLSSILESRATAGALALAGQISGSPSFYGSAHASEDLQADVLQPAEEPIAYSQYIAPAYPFMQDNLVQPLSSSSGPLIAAFQLTMSESTRHVTNMPFLVGLGVGPSDITIRQPTCFPLMKDFQ